MKKITLLLISLVSFFSVNAQCVAGQKEVIIEIVPDNYPAEVTWDLTANGALIATGNYIGDTICVDENACLSFTIHDQANDGLCCAYGTGYFNLILDGVIVGTGGDYGTSQTVNTNCAPGSFCSDAIVINQGNHSAPNQDFWYSFTPAETGMYEISTCGLSSCDTKIWVYEFCNGMATSNDPTNVGTLFYDDNEGGCGQQAVVNAYMAGGQEYKIRIGLAPGATCGNIDFSINYTGPVVGCTDPNACNYNPLATVSDNSCIYFPSPQCPGGPDLVIMQDAILNSIEIRQQAATDCMVEEGCMNGYGERTVLAFDTHIKNIGDMDYYIGSPATNPDQFTFENCHGHAHYEGYADYILYSQDGGVIPIGQKNGFCVLDLECGDGGTAQYGCGNMGISHQCGDIYGAYLDCQWVDITDVEPGEYILAVKVNWDQSPDALGRQELTYENNWAQVCVRITETAGIKGFELLPDCQPYEDCAGTPYGNAVIDCEGNCGGSAVQGDLDINASVQTADVQMYNNSVLAGNLAATNCNDLSGDGILSVWDAGLAYHCANIGMSNACDFPNTVQNLNHYVEIGYTEINFDESYIDVYIKNPINKISAYELNFTGITIADVQNLIDPASYPITPQFSAASSKVIGFSYVDSLMPKSFTNTPLVRVFFSEITSATNEICVDAVHVLNENFEPTFTNVLEPCVAIASIDEKGMPSFSLKPNPAKNTVSIEMGVKLNEKLAVSITDALGRIVSESEISANENSVEIDVTNLSNGFYQVVISNSNVFKTKHLVVKH